MLDEETVIGSGAHAPGRTSSLTTFHGSGANSLSELRVQPLTGARLVVAVATREPKRRFALVLSEATVFVWICPPTAPKTWHRTSRTCLDVFLFFEAISEGHRFVLSIGAMRQVSSDPAVE